MDEPKCVSAITRHALRRSPLLSICVVALVLFAAGLTASPAEAHSRLVKVSPGIGASLTFAPGRVELIASEPIDVDRGENTIAVIDPSGQDVSTGKPVADLRGHRLTVELDGNLEPGQYQVRWAFVSAEDGDRSSDSFIFSFDPSGSADSGSEVLRSDLLRAIVADSAQAGSSGFPWVLSISALMAFATIADGGLFLLEGARA